MPSRHGQVRVRLWERPCPTALVVWLVVWLHGSAYIRGGVDMPEAMAVGEDLANAGAQQ